MPNIDLSILNQRQTPAFYADTLANRPAAGFVGRIFVSTDTFAFYRDNGTTWDLIGGPGTGTVTGTGAAGQVTYWNGASTITGTNNLFYDTVNSRLGVNTNTPGNAFDVHSSTSPIAGFNQTTATNNSLLVLLNSGTALWRIGSFYNAGANDFGVYDVVGAIQPVTIKKTTGQVLIGTSTVGTGKLVVVSATSDNGIQIVGATAPSLRIDSAETGPTKRIGLAIATNTNNFIQGSADRDMCIFNGSTTASPMLFGIYDAGAVSVQEAARISAARNFLIGTTTDAGIKLEVNGTSRSTQLDVNNSAGLMGYLNSTNANGGYFVFQTSGTTIADIGTATQIFGSGGNDIFGINARGARSLVFGANNAERMRITSAGNVGIGFTTPTEKLTVDGNILLRSAGAVKFNRADNAIYTQLYDAGSYFALDNRNGNGFDFQSAGSSQFRIKPTGVINIASIPTSAAGLSSGDLWSNLGIINIVP